jgi:RND superfamily putative drug exporter
MVFIKELGLGIAFAVLIDASLVRALLVPSLMALLGRLNWWAPRPLRLVYERFGLREAASPSASSSPEPMPPSPGAAHIHSARAPATSGRHPRSGSA